MIVIALILYACKIALVSIISQEIYLSLENLEKKRIKSSDKKL